MLLHTFAIPVYEKSCNSFGIETFEIEQSQNYSFIVCHNKHQLFRTETENCFVWNVESLQKIIYDNFNVVSSIVKNPIKSSKHSNKWQIFYKNETV